MGEPFNLPQSQSLSLNLLQTDRSVKQRVGFPGGSVVKNPPANAGGMGLIPGSERSLKEGNGNPLQYCCLGNPMDRGAWQANTVYGVTKSETQLKRLSTHTATWMDPGSIIQSEVSQTEEEKYHMTSPICGM